jgi:hypothetical protein
MALSELAEGLGCCLALRHPQDVESYRFRQWPTLPYIAGDQFRVALTERNTNRQ